ncbi:MAG: glutamine amidotransferase family protein [Armatimonadetes bacterium]|nr:glutamine amidotransferase family protein [Armatimonadota bacterium]
MRFRNLYNERNRGACGLIGWMSRSGRKQNGEAIMEAIANMRERGNGLGGGFAAYGIYPQWADQYCFHLMYGDQSARSRTEDLLAERFEVVHHEEIPTKPHSNITDAPILWRYFLNPARVAAGVNDDDYVVQAVMDINVGIEDAFVFSSGKNMGAFKAVGYPEDVGRFFMLDHYEAYIWTAHARFPTNTQAWWGGAHPFCLLDFSVVHNGEISSYGINRRYLEMFGYKCTLFTDTEVMVYLFDLLVRKHGLPLELAADVVAAPFWKDIDAEVDEEQKRLRTTLRQVYASAMVNGPFAIILGFGKGMLGLNDRIKLRPMVAGEHGDELYISSEEAAIHVMCPKPDRVWMPKAGEPVIGYLNEQVLAAEASGAGK